MTREFVFRHVGLGENAGWGLRDVFRNGQQLGNIPPRIDNDKRRNASRSCWRGSR